jgi:hypothetical protein
LKALAEEFNVERCREKENRQGQQLWQWLLRWCCPQCACFEPGLRIIDTPVYALIVGWFVFKSLWSVWGLP